jgi:hypothetical protein
VVAAATLLLAISIVSGLVATVTGEARRTAVPAVRSPANAFVFDVHDRIEFLGRPKPAR